MPLTENRIIRTSCPHCGQEALKIIRRIVDGTKPAAGKLEHEACHACMLKGEQKSKQLFLIRQWRLMWIAAGGRLETLPDCLRMPDDPPSRPPASAALPPAKPPQQLRGIRGADTPSWKSPARVVLPGRPPTPRPRVLFVSHDLEPQGAQRFLLNLLPHLRGIEPYLFAHQDGPLHGLLLEQGIPVLTEWRPEQFALIVVNTLASWPALERAKAAGVPAVWLIHEWGLSGLIEPAKFEELIQYPRKTVCVHAAQKTQFPALKDRSTAVIPAVVPPRIGQRCDPATRASQSPADSFVVLSFGRDEPRKGQADLRSACEGLDVHLQIVQGSLAPAEALARADVYVSTSRAECYPLSLQEAKHYRLPVIATNLPAHRDMVDNGVNGYLYEPGDVEYLRELILRLKEDAALRQTMGERPLRAADWETTLESWERLIVGEAGGGRAAAEDLWVVYHACGMGEHYREVMTEQMELLARHGLRHVLCTHCGEGLDWLCQEARRHGVDLVICHHEDHLTGYERPALEVIERLAAQSDRAVLYLHSKAVSHSASETWYGEWRKLMQDELVPHWRQHVRDLDSYDVVGVNWWTAAEKWHFSGNFWMASARWLRKLPPIGKYWRDRFSAERWIGSVEGCQAKSLLCKDAAFWDRDRALLHELRNAQLARHQGANRQ